MKVGEIVKIKTPLDFCNGVYNNVEAKVKKILWPINICCVDLIKEKDKIRVDRLGYVNRDVRVNVSYCRAKVTKLNI